jgi:steroid 5-alpha reductase family enzyme
MLVAFAAVLCAMAVTMVVAWASQRALGNAGWVDVFWTFGSGAALAGAALWPASDSAMSRQILVACLVGVWSARLGLHLAYRVAGSHEDSRYVGLRKTWGARFQRELLFLAAKQGPATALLSLSVYAAAHAGTQNLGARDYLGAAILLIAIGGEALADEQMRRFKARGERAPIMQQGLWSWSRHPNYFFEWFAWLAYPAIAFDPSLALTWATWIAPALMYVILRHGTGVPMLEASMLESRGAAFRDYQARVSVFFPLPPRRADTGRSGQ